MQPRKLLGSSQEENKAVQTVFERIKTEAKGGEEMGGGGNVKIAVCVTCPIPRATSFRVLVLP